MFDVLVAGEINPDLILSGDVVPRFGQAEQLLDTASLTIGSSSAIFACGSARLGLKTAMIGVCGDDLFGRFMLEELRARHVDVQSVMVRGGESTGLSVILSQGVDRSILTFPGAIGALRASDIGDELLRQCRHLHVASYYLQTNLRPDLPALFERARRLGLSTSLDTNFDPAEEWRSPDALLGLTDVLLLNHREAMALSRAPDLQGALDKLPLLVRTLAVKLGPRGAIGARDGELVRVPALEVTVADTVGAGDSFDAGFVYGILNHWDLERSLRLASACGALSTRKAGGTDGQPTLEEAMKHVPG
jgi:sugar/nucleoside kinase (ribokinase family)